MRGYFKVIKQQRDDAREQRNAAWDRILSQSALSKFEQADIKQAVLQLQERQDGTLLQLGVAQQERDDARKELQKVMRRLAEAEQGLKTVPAVRAYVKATRKRMKRIAEQCSPRCTQKENCRACRVAMKVEVGLKELLGELEAKP